MTLPPALLKLASEEIVPLRRIAAELGTSIVDARSALKKWKLPDNVTVLHAVSTIDESVGLSSASIRAVPDRELSSVLDNARSSGLAVSTMEHGLAPVSRTTKSSKTDRECPSDSCVLSRVSSVPIAAPKGRLAAVGKPGYRRVFVLPHSEDSNAKYVEFTDNPNAVTATAPAAREKRKEPSPPAAPAAKDEKPEKPTSSSTHQLSFKGGSLTGTAQDKASSSSAPSGKTAPKAKPNPKAKGTSRLSFGSSASAKSPPPSSCPDPREAEDGSCPVPTASPLATGAAPRPEALLESDGSGSDSEHPSQWSGDEAPAKKEKAPEPSASADPRSVPPCARTARMRTGTARKPAKPRKPRAKKASAAMDEAVGESDGDLDQLEEEAARYAAAGSDVQMEMEDELGELSDADDGGAAGGLRRAYVSPVGQRRRKRGELPHQSNTLDASLKVTAPRAPAPAANTAGHWEDKIVFDHATGEYVSERVWAPDGGDESADVPAADTQSPKRTKLDAERAGKAAKESESKSKHKDSAGGGSTHPKPVGTSPQLSHENSRKNRGGASRRLASRVANPPTDLLHRAGNQKELESAGLLVSDAGTTSNDPSVPVDVALETESVEDSEVDQRVVAPDSALGQRMVRENRAKEKKRPSASKSKSGSKSSASKSKPKATGACAHSRSPCPLWSS